MTSVELPFDKVNINLAVDFWTLSKQDETARTSEKKRFHPIKRGVLWTRTGFKFPTTYKYRGWCYSIFCPFLDRALDFLQICCDIVINVDSYVCLWSCIAVGGVSLSSNIYLRLLWNVSQTDSPKHTHPHPHSHIHSHSHSQAQAFFGDDSTFNPKKAFFLKHRSTLIVGPFEYTWSGLYNCQHYCYCPNPVTHHYTGVILGTVRWGSKFESGNAWPPTPYP